MDYPLALSFSCIFEKVSCIAGRMPRIGNEEISMIDHIPIGPDNSNLTRDIFHPWRIVGTVKSIRHRNRALCWMVRQQ